MLRKTSYSNKTLIHRNNRLKALGIHSFLELSPTQKLKETTQLNTLVLPIYKNYGPNKTKKLYDNAQYELKSWLAGLQAFFQDPQNNSRYKTREPKININKKDKETYLLSNFIVPRAILS